MSEGDRFKTGNVKGMNLPRRLPLRAAILVSAIVPVLIFPGTPTQGAGTAPVGIFKINHVVIIMQENRSFDNYFGRSEEHTSELQSLRHLVCRLLLEKKKE